MTLNGRTSDYPIDAMFLERWSTRAFDAKPMPLETLRSREIPSDRLHLRELAFEGHM